MTNRPIVSLSLAAALSLSSLLGVSQALFVTGSSGFAAQAADGGDSKAAKSASTKSSSKKVSKQSATGLDPVTLKAINTGDWNKALENLESQTASATEPVDGHAWLAFGMMFTGKCAELKDLSKKLDGMSEKSKDTMAGKLTNVFNLTCQNKFDEANSVLGTLGSDNKNVILNLANAAVAAKRGNPTDAISFCEKVVAQAPDFAWAYRTLGFIQERSLKDTAAAEESYKKAIAAEPAFKEARDLLVDLRLSKNDFDGAIDAAQEAIKLYPMDANNYYRLSQIYTQQWRLREANSQLEKAIKRNPENPRFHRARASIYRYQNDFPSAVKEQEQAVALSKDKAFELMELAALYELSGNLQLASDKLAEAMKAAPTNQAAHQKLVQLLTKQKRFDDLAAEYRRALVLQPKSANLHLGLAETLLKLGQTEKAMDELKEAANLDTNDPRPHRQLGAIHISRKEFEQAAKAYTRALNINPGSVDDLVALGYTYAQNEDYMQAETAFVTALALQQLTQTSGSRWEVMRSLAVLLLTEGRYSEAATNLEAIVASDKTSPTHGEDEFLLSQAKALRDRSSESLKTLMDSFNALPDADKPEQRLALVDTLLKLGKAEQALEQLALIPESETQKSAQLLAMQAMAQRMKGDAAKAEELATKATSLNDDAPENRGDAYLEVGRIQLAKGNLNGAEEAVTKALQLNPKSFPAFELQGRIFLKKGDSQKAITSGKKALEVNPYYVPAYMLTGDAYLQANKYDEAANNFKRAVELYPAWVEAHKSLRDVYKKLAQKEDAQKEDDIIAQIEKRS